MKLHSLRIRNLVLIEEAQVFFHNQLNVVTGETGSGKTILLQAIGLVLGEKSRPELVRRGSDELVVEGIFSFEAMHPINERLASFEIHSEENEILVVRKISATGKSRIFINDRAVTLGTLQKIMEGCVELSTQHENQTFLQADSRTLLLDRIGGSEELAKQFAGAFSKRRALHLQVSQLDGKLPELVRNIDYLRFQLSELEAASSDLSEESETSLLDRKSKINNFLRERQWHHAALEALEGNENSTGAISLLRDCLRSHSRGEHEDGVRDRISASLLALEEATMLIHQSQQGSESSDGELLEIEERLARIAQLKRRFAAPTTEDLLSQKIRFEAELAESESLLASIPRLKSERDELNKCLRECAFQLRKVREAAKAKLELQVVKALRPLGLEDARFESRLIPIDNFEDWNIHGSDEIDFYFSAQSSTDMHPISKIASGGERSRILLGIRSVIADKDKVGLFIFDEIDAGVGGETAFNVGQKLKKVSKDCQVICITHLPQVAAFADNHIAVRKVKSRSETLTQVEGLRDDSKKHELARMLGTAGLRREGLESVEGILKKTKNLERR